MQIILTKPRMDSSSPLPVPTAPPTGIVVLRIYDGEGIDSCVQLYLDNPEQVEEMITQLAASKTILSNWAADREERDADIISERAFTRDNFGKESQLR